MEEIILTIPTEGIVPELTTTVSAPKGIKNKFPLGGVAAPNLTARYWITL